jgi:hypothetical protein
MSRTTNNSLCIAGIWAKGPPKYDAGVLTARPQRSLWPISFIHFLVGSQLEYRAPFGVSVITQTIRPTVGLLWTSYQPIAEASTYIGQHNI